MSKTEKVTPANLYPHPVAVEFKSDYIRFDDQATLILPNAVSPEIITFFTDSWANFTRNQVELEIVMSETAPENSFLLFNGSVTPQSTVIQADQTSALVITVDGAAGTGRSENDLKHAWILVLQLLLCGRGESSGAWLLPMVSIQDKPKLDFRGMHLCIFPETTLEFVDNMIMLAAFHKYSHIVIEFWGMLKFDCMKELSWPNAFPKEQIKPLLDKARRMGVEPIPMFNHWGHATCSRVRSGKHVVLDQNPDLEPLFEPDGWTWCFSNPDTVKLLADIRTELRELFGDIAYFHLGCDEAYSHASCYECMKQEAHELLANYLNSVNDDLKQYEIRPIIWGDTFLEKGLWDGYTSLGRPAQRTSEALELLSRNFIINDWQYGIRDSKENATLNYFVNKGFEVIMAPWNNEQNIKVLADMSISHNIMGMMLTTWHNLPSKIANLSLAADCMWGGSELADSPRLGGGKRSATLGGFMRKLRGTSATYENAGWHQDQTFKD